MEQGQVDGEGLRVFLLVKGVAVQPHGLYAHQGAEEVEGLEADVVQIGDEVVVRRSAFRQAGAPDGDHGGGQDEEETGAAQDAGPLDHALLVLFLQFLRIHHLLVNQGHDNVEGDQDDENVTGTELERDTAQEQLEQDAQRNDDDSAPHGGAGGRTFPQQAQAEHHDDAGIDEAGVFLDVLEGLVQAAQQRFHGYQGDGEGAQGSDTAHVDKLFVAGSLVDVLLVDVHGKQRGRGVEHGGQGGDDGGGEGGKGEALYTHRGEVAHQPGIGVIGHVDRTLQMGEGFRMQRNVVGADTGEAHDEGDEDFEETGEHQAFLGFFHALGGKALLDDVLVEAPITQVGKPYATHDGGDAGHIGEAGRVVAFLDDQVEVCVVQMVAGGEVREDVVQTAQDTGVAADGLEGEPGGDEAAAHQEGNLQDVRPGHGGKTAVDGVNTGNQEQGHHNDHAHGNAPAANHEHGALQAQDLLDGQGAQPGDGGKVHEHIQEQPQDGERKADTVVITFAQELRNGENFAFEHDRQQELADNHQGDGGHEFISGRRDTVRIGGSGHADKLFCRDVGGDERGTHGPPCEGVAGQEVVAGALFFAFLGAAQKQAQEDKQRKIDEDNHQIDSPESGGCNLVKNVHRIIVVNSFSV